MIVDDGWWRLMVVDDGWWWLMMLCDGLWWLLMVDDGLWWLMMVDDGRWWLMMVDDGLCGFVMVDDGCWWLMMDLSVINVVHLPGFLGTNWSSFIRFPPRCCVRLPELSEKTYGSRDSGGEIKKTGLGFTTPKLCNII